MTATRPPEISFVRLTEISAGEILAHMSDPRVAVHLPLATFDWNLKRIEDFVAAKEEHWKRDGLGHWAILCDGAYVGWGGFQKEGDEWDFGLVLKPDCFGLGPRIAKVALQFASDDRRIDYVTFLLPPSRKRLKGLSRLGAVQTGEVVHKGERFLKFRLQTS